MLRKVRMTDDHNGYKSGEIVELEHPVADVFVAHCKVAVYVDSFGETAADKMIRDNADPKSKKLARTK